MIYYHSFENDTSVIHLFIVFAFSSLVLYSTIYLLILVNAVFTFRSLAENIPARLHKVNAFKIVMMLNFCSMVYNSQVGE